MTNPDSLCAKVLKGKYFHDSDFLHARQKKRSYHTWHAILKGRNALELGLTKQIGKGDETRIWEDRWIPDVTRCRPLGKPPEAEAVFANELHSPNGRN